MRERAPRIFLLSPANCGGQRARLVLNDASSFELALRLRTPAGAPLGAVFAFLSGLYFRGKLAYAQAFAQAPRGRPGVLVITAGGGLRPSHEPVRVEDLRRFAKVRVDLADERYRRPLERDAAALAAGLHREGEVVLLGSVATGKYVDILAAALGDRLKFPAEFVGRGDMSRGGLLLRSVEAGQELSYIPVAGAVRHGPRPPRLEPRRWR